MTEGENEPRVHDPSSPATEAQRRKLIAVGCDPNAANDARLSKGTASAWIDDFKRAAERKAAEAGGFTPADQLPSSGTAPPGQSAVMHPAPATAPAGPTAIEAYSDDEDRTPLTPIAAMGPDDRKRYAIEESGTVVIQGTKWKIVPELGMPAKFVFARLSVNRRTGLPEARLFPSIEGLIFRANAYNHGIKGYTYEFIDQKDIPGLAPFLEETKDPELICRVHVTLGDGTDVVEHGSVRLSEIKLYQSRRTGKMVARSPVARSNPTELAVKRALARALRWGTGFGGTALDELPVPESEEARERAGLKGGPAALPSPQDGTG